MLDNVADLWITVTDLKQFTHCPRIVYYEKCLPHIRPRTYKMDAGRDAHLFEKQRAERRTLAAYGLKGGERQFDQIVESERLGLRGTVDEIVFADNGEIFPIDYKLAKRVSSHHRLQLAAYAILLEEHYSTAISIGYIYLIHQRKTHTIKITAQLRNKLDEAIYMVKQVSMNEKMPEPTTQQGKCRSCEFHRFCNDISW